MTGEIMVEHTARIFDAELHALSDKVLEMGRFDDEQIVNAIQALSAHDTALAKCRHTPKIFIAKPSTMHLRLTPATHGRRRLHIELHGQP